MADYVSIANLVASRIGEDDQIRTPDDDTHLARTVKAVWDNVRQECIREHSWNFAMARDALTADISGAVTYPFGYGFPLPADCLRLVEVLNITDGCWQLEGGRLLANTLGPIYVRYLRDVTEAALWDASFTAYFEARLEATIGVRIAGSNYDVARGERNARAVLAKAKGTDARENPPVQSDLSDFELAHLGGDGFDYPYPPGN